MSNSDMPFDWRYRVATTTAEDYTDSSGNVAPKGSLMARATFVKHGNKKIPFGDPSAPALFLDISYKAYRMALSSHPFLLSQWPPVDWQGDPSTRIFDYLENIMTSIVFAYTAIESFANELIPEDFIYEFHEERSNGLVVVHRYGKGDIERKLSLSQKLSDILPKITKRPSPKGSKTWEGYVTLRRLRDRIIHLKNVDRDYSKAGKLYPDSIWSTLLAPKQPNFPLIAKKMIVYFVNDKSMYWLKRCPF